MDKNKQKWTIFILAGLLVVLLYIILMSGIMEKLFSGKQPDQNYISPIVLAEEEMETIRNQAHNLFFKERDYDVAIQKQKEALSLAETISLDDEFYNKLNLASFNLRNNPIRAYALYAEVYQSPLANDFIKAEVLQNVMWSFAALYGRKGIDLQFAQEKVFSADSFGDVLPEGFVLNDYRSVTHAITHGFEKAIELNPDPDKNQQYLSYVLLAHHLPSRFKHTHPDSFDSAVTNRMKELLKTARPAIEVARDQSIEIGKYKSAVAAAFFYSARTHLSLNQYGLLNDPEDFYLPIQATLKYTAIFKDKNFNATTFALDAAFVYSIGSFRLNNFDAEKVDKIYLRSLLREHVYTISDEDLERRHVWMKSYGNSPAEILAEHPGYRLAHQKTFILLANEVDPDFRQFLLERKVPGWDEVDFTPEIWFTKEN